MSSVQHATEMCGGSAARAEPASVKRFGELLVRTLYGSLLAAIAIGMTFAGGFVFAAFVALAAIAAAREWHRMVGARRFAREWIATSLAIAAAVVAAEISGGALWPMAILSSGAVLAAAMGATRGASPYWSGLGPIYVGVAACSLVGLRVHTPHAQWVVLGLFLVIWTADTGALIAGRIFGGPKLVPVLSPSKTWSGLVGGLALPGLVGAGYVAALQGSPVRAFAVAFVLAAAGHAGDLFESWIKRRVGRKDSGGSIPGHGGVLDRLDSTLFVAPLAAALIFTFGVAALFGVRT